MPRAVTIADAVRDILTALGQWARELERTPNAIVHRSTSLSAREVKLLCSFFDDAVGALKKLWGAARARNEIPPQYPRALEEVRRILAQLLMSASAV